jgi:Lipid desaturase domain
MPPPLVTAENAVGQATRRRAMSVPALPGRSVRVVVVAVLAICGTATDLALRGEVTPLAFLAALLLSALLADAITALAHFSFDYIFPYDFPIFGPIAKGFNEHHEEPSLDPKDAVENFTLGGYGSCAVSLLSLGVILFGDHGPVSSFVLLLLLFLAIWGLLFHHLHSYAHMGSLLDPRRFTSEVERIAGLDDKRQQKAALRALFATVPTPRFIKLLQRLRLTLEPGRHNLHHIHFESDFSSVNGWSDPLLNPILRPAARYFKAKRSASLPRSGQD